MFIVLLFFICYTFIIVMSCLVIGETQNKLRKACQTAKLNFCQYKTAKLAKNKTIFHYL
ncbi:hypothetical protein BACINT_03213 [Bacteroides intestinalis DSM 17393]|uniref:Uncharacterized protein n=1 Tax=Bacteroides intestinalis DSM 17393 TaxID=471870 RepID=B3CIN0_9BACE|nr:hypothetical protein BACINT_03213 [Bacteroides intestinalis DSM 17393]